MDNQKVVPIRSPKNKNRGIPARTLGPVQNLEDYVSPEWWRQIFNHLYLKTDGDVVEDSAITKTEVDQFVAALELKTDEKMLDLCCGQGRHTIEMNRRGHVNVEGFDRSRYLIQKARSQARNENLSVKFREGDARKLPYKNDTFDVVFIAGNSFGYFDKKNDDLKVLKEVHRVLKPWGRLLIDLADGSYLKEKFQPRSWEWINDKLFVCRERSLAQDEERLVSREVITDVNKGVIADQFYAERLYTKETVSKILNTAGFSAIDFKNEMTPDSQRDQDLGMMARRLVVVSIVKKEWTRVPVKASSLDKNVTVILGDPSVPDLLKPQSVFDDDDFFTIDKMKEALRELPGYRFSYVNNHSKIINDLGKLNGKTDYVLNLCDEGFSNDPRKELHVPALLEMLNIPYSGAGPQCLAFCYDKSLVRGIAKEMDIPVPHAVFIKPEDNIFDLPFAFPAIVKPNFGDSSFGITAHSVVNEPEKLIDAVNEIRHTFGYDKTILIEELLTGKDLTIGIIGNHPSQVTVLPIVEEDYSSLPEGLPKICGYEAKWQPDSPYWNLKSIPAKLPEKTVNAITDWSLALSERLECRDYMRFDWRLDGNGTPKLLEANPNPGWCWDGHLAKMAAFVGMSYPQMLSKILETVEERININGNAMQASKTNRSVATGGIS